MSDKPDDAWSPGEAGVNAAIIMALQTIVHSMFSDAEREALATARCANVDNLSYGAGADPEASATLRTVAHSTIAKIFGKGA